VELFAGGSRREGSRGKTDIVIGVLEAPQISPVLGMTHVIGKVLAQRAAKGHVEQLHPAADAEHGHVAGSRRTHQRQLGSITLRNSQLGLGMGLLPVCRWIAVASPGEHQSIHQIEHLVWVVFDGLVRGNDER
jgi:hypothetical protein